MIATLTDRLMACYEQLHAHYGYEPHWWPIFGPHRQWEIMLGAVLVQQSKWERVEQAIQGLLAAGIATPAALVTMAQVELAPFLAGVAYPNQKAPYLIQLAQHMHARAGDDLGNWLQQPTAALRRELLALPGIGPETADTILLYAGNHPVFVIDAYLRRLLSRLDLVANNAALSYTALQHVIEAALPPDLDLGAFPHLGGQQAMLFWDFHALVNEHCIHHCLSRRPHCDSQSAPRRPFAQPQKCAEHCPPCGGCPLRPSCHAYREHTLPHH